MANEKNLQRIIDLRKQYLQKKTEAKKEMETGNLNTYFEKLNAILKTRKEFAEALNTEVPVK